MQMLTQTDEFNKTFKIAVNSQYRSHYKILGKTKDS